MLMTEHARFGPRVEPTGGVTFRLWAPGARSVDWVGGETLQMPPIGGGWYELLAPQARAGDRYRFRIDGALDVPDPASHFQPQDVNGPSEVIDHRYDWQCADWKGRPWAEAVALELHVGAFSPGGTFCSAIDKLDAVAATGFTAIELMPVADFAGRRNWGYDGVLHYAPDSAYGRPEHLKALVDAAHARGLMVFLDVVYNHFGPEGNYLGRYAPAVFTTDRQTPWGPAIDYRVPEVRAFAISNALHWLDRYRFDGLRLDAVHAIRELGAPSVLEDLSRAAGTLAAAQSRHIHLVVENDDNRATWLDPDRDIPAGRFRAQWNDDYHHAWHVLLTGEHSGYYADYAADPRRRVARALASGFVYQGERSKFRNEEPRGEPSGYLPPAAFVNFLQNHDQIGNRAYAERLTTLASAEAVEAALAVLLLAPFPPLMFMGEEWGATQPFPFFCDFAGELGEAVRRGRAAEFKDQFASAAGQKPIPDPLTEATFRSAVLRWEDRERAPHAARLALVTKFLTERRARVVPRLAGSAVVEGRASVDGAVLTAAWRLADGSELRLNANLSGEQAARPVSAAATPKIIWGGEMPERLPPWAVYWGWSS
jgi:malto-oligosyltrehalose trehalohydrolase